MDKQSPNQAKDATKAGFAIATVPFLVAAGLIIHSCTNQEDKKDNRPPSTPTPTLVIPDKTGR